MRLLLLLQGLKMLILLGFWLPGGWEILEPEGRKNLMGNNPMVGATVAVAVAVAQAMAK